MQLQQLSLLTVNNKKNTWTRGSEERSENALCVLRRCCLDELLSAQRAQSSSHASLQLPPPGGAGERNVVMSLLLHDYWRIDLCLWATCVFPTLQRRHKHSMAKVFVFFIQLFFSTKGAFRRSLTYDDHSLQSCPALIAQNYSWRTRTTSNVQRWTEIWTKYELCRAKTERQYDRKTERQKDCTCTYPQWESCELFQ